MENKKVYFEGWYFKVSTKNFSIAFIPAHFKSKDEETVVVQVINNNNSYLFNFNKQDFLIQKKPFAVKIKNNFFSLQKLNLKLQNEKVKIEVDLQLTQVLNKKINAMGIFKYFPCMECKHNVLSLLSTANGTIKIDEKLLQVKNGICYIETDNGKSFPKEYGWTQFCNYSENKFCIMMSIAKIPYLFNFLGCVCVIYFKNKIYKFASYNGARVVRFTEDTLAIKKGKTFVIAQKLTDNSQQLLAPKNAKLDQKIKKNISCKIKYTIIKNSKQIFTFTADNGSFEYANLQ